jgi:hypothetical protein
MNRTLHAARAAALLLCAAAAFAQDKPQGFLCCNMRSDGKWISDSNYEENGKTMIPLGTPAKVTAYGRNRVYVEFPEGAQQIGNDYSRSLRPEEFARRYVVAENPLEKLVNMPPKIQAAIKSARVTNGMTREQVIMALGWPMASENPHLDLNVWHYWLWTFQSFEVRFDDSGRVSEVSAGTRDLLDRVYLR